MGEFVFIRPWWLAAIPAGLALVWWLWRHDSRGGAWESIIDPVLLPHLVVGVSVPRREWPWVVMALAVVVAGLALAGPAFERLEQPVFHSRAARVIVLDISRSMDARDLAPSRMVRARHKVSDLLQRNRDGRTGLVVFAGDAFVVAPLTHDVATLIHLLPALDTRLTPVQGSRPDRGLLVAGELIEKGQAATGEIILITDGMKDTRTRDAAEALAARDIRVSLLAVGTEEGAPVSLPEGGFLRGSNDAIVVARVDMAALREVARAGRGRFATVTADDSDVEWLLGVAADQPWDGELEETERTIEQWRDEGPWLVLLLLPAVALAFRRGWLLGLLIGLSLPVAEVDAFDFAAWWTRSDQRAAQAIEQGDTDQAVAVAPDHRWRGTALYRGERYDASAEMFAAGDTADDYYNRGNALARAGDLRGALDAYREALDRHPEHADAAHNRAIVESQLAAQPQQGAGDEHDGEPGPDSGTDEGGAGGEESDNPESSPQQGSEAAEQGAGSAGAPDTPAETGGDDPPQSSAAAGSTEAGEGDEQHEAGDQEGVAATAESARDGAVDHSLTEEQKAAYEQWLRRIPDDPGGLLRRKFALEYQTRERESPARSDRSDAW